MFRSVSVGIIFSLLVMACNDSGKPEKPQNLISKEQMSALLYDLYLINGAKGSNKKLLEKNGLNPEEYILEKHNIDSIQFAESNNYYAYDTETYKAILDKVKARLEKEKKVFEAIKKKENDSIKKRKDSILKRTTQLKEAVKTRDSLGLTNDSLKIDIKKLDDSKIKSNVVKGLKNSLKDRLKRADSLR